MIIARAPFRISFAGGGTDPRKFYSQEYGCVTSTGINKYMYIAVHKFFDKRKILLKYSKTEFVDSVEKIEHPIFREALRMVGIESGIEITSIADIPSGTGLGSSSTFTVALLNALYAYKGKFVSHERLAREASKIEIDILGEPIGKQDQYAAAFGNLNHIRFNPDETVNVMPIVCNPQTKMQLQKNLMLFYTGITRSTKSILSRQNSSIEGKKLENLQKLKRLAEELKDALNSDNLNMFGEIMHRGWLLKRELTTGITNPEIDEWYNKAREAGAIGGKLLGAGGGGFLLFYCPEDKRDRVRAALPLQEIPFSFDTQGSKIIYVGEKTNTEETKMKEFRENYFRKLMEGLEKVPAEHFEEVANILLDAWENEKQVFIFGNGGSATTATHFASDLGKGTMTNVYDMSEKRSRVISLNDNMAMFTALANDLHYDDVFAQQLRHLLKEGDVVIGISASGNSPNVVNAIKLAKGMNAKTIGFLGFEGGKMKGLCDVSLHFPEKSYQRAEDAHLIFEHLLTSYIYEKKKERSAQKKAQQEQVEPEQAPQQTPQPTQTIQI